MSVFLLDTNLLIALLWPSHEHHDKAISWFTGHRVQGWATSPITEAGFVRIVSNPAFSRDAVSPREAVAVLAANTAAPDHRFWPDDLPYAEAVSGVGVRLIGHQQATDAYLLGLAAHKKGMLASLDQRISALIQPKSPLQSALLIIA